MTDAELLAELDKPAYAAMRAVRNDTSIAAMFAELSEGATVWRTSVPRADLLKVVVGVDAYPELMAARDQQGGPFRSVCYGFLLMLNNPDSAIDFSDENNRQLAGALDGVTPELGTTLLAVGKRLATLAESLWGTGISVTVDDISRVLNNE